MKFKKLISAAVISGALGISGVANGAIFDINSYSYAAGSVSGEVTLDGETRRVPAGMFRLNTELVDGTGTPPTDIFSQVLAFCLEVDVFLNRGQYDLVGAPEYFDEAKLGSVEALFRQHIQKTGNRENDVAFQLALWEIVYDDDLSLVEAGDEMGFSASSEDFGNSWAKAEEWLSTISKGGTFDDLWVFQAPGMDVTRSSQDLITWKVPEPASLALIGAGLIGFGALRRRKAA